MVATVFLDVAARGARWRALLAPDQARCRYRRVLGYTYLGYLANNVLPARLGELVRSHALGEGEGISRTTVLGTVVVERVVDTVIVVGHGGPRGRRAERRAGSMTSAVLLGAAFVAPARRRAWSSRMALPPAARRGPGHGVRRALAAGRRAGPAAARRAGGGEPSPRTLVRALAFSAVAWTASIATFVAGGQAVGVELTIAQGALLSTGVALATIVPSGPGYLGTFELTAVAIAAIVRGRSRLPRSRWPCWSTPIQLLVTSVGGVIAALRLRGRDWGSGRSIRRAVRRGRRRSRAPAGGPSRRAGYALSGSAS